MRPGLTYSLILHMFLIVMSQVGVSFFSSQEVPQEKVFTVELLPVSQVSNVKPVKIQPKLRPKAKEKMKQITPQKKARVPLPDPVRKPLPVVESELKLANNEKKKLPVDVKPVVKRKPQPKPKPKLNVKEEELPTVKKPNRDSKLSFDTVLKNLENDLDLKEQQDLKTDNKEFEEVEDFLTNLSVGKGYKPGLPLTLNERDAIRNQISKNWTIFAGAKGAHDMKVKLRISLGKDGIVREVEHLDYRRYKNDPFFRAMVDSAIRAVYKSSPLQNLPIEKYDVKGGWRELVLNFDPQEMFY